CARSSRRRRWRQKRARRTDRPVSAVDGHGASGDAPRGAPGAGPGGDAGRRKRRRPEPTPAQRALGLLVRREHSRKELANKLVSRGVARGEAEAVVERMASEGWQDDARFAASLARM